LAVCPRTTIKMSSPVKRRSSGGVNKSRAAGNATVTSSSKKAGDRDARKARKAKFAEPERSPLAKLILSIFGFWAAIGGIFILHGLASGTLLPDWAVTLMNPGELTMELIEAGDGEHRAVAGDEVQIEYTATVTATGKTFDSSQGRGPMKFEVGAEPPKALIALDMAVQNMTLGETAEVKCTAPFAFGSRAIGEGENMVPPNSDITFEVTLVAINDLLAPEPEEEEETYEDLWEDLSDEEMEAAKVLGWSEENWGKHTSLTETPFAELTEEQQEAVEVLGYDEETWEDPEEFSYPDEKKEAEDGDNGSDDEE